MSFSVALTQATHDALQTHLLRPDGQEDLTFVLWRPSGGRCRRTALIGDELILPRAGERHVHGNAAFEPAYFLRALAHAHERGAGLGLIHSHPQGAGWQGLSSDDRRAETGHAAQAKAATGRPLVGLTMAGDGALSGRLWTGSRLKPQLQDAISVRVVGERLSVTWHPCQRPAPKATARQLRTVSAWGLHAQQHLVRLRVAVVGAGSVGSLVAEALARTGLIDVVLIDFDSVKDHNLDRLLHASRRDVALASSKVESLARALRQSATAEDAQIEPLELSVVEPAGWEAALDCDVIFSCVDRPWPRAALNLAAYSHLIPVIDGGIAVNVAHGRLRGADWKAHVAAPSRRCLECAGQYDPGLVQAEREGQFEDSNYIRGLPDDHPLHRSENVFAFSSAVASAEMLQFLSMVIAPRGIADVGAHNYHFVTGRMDVDATRCRAGCPYSEALLAMGEDCNVVPTAQHSAAESEREQRLTRRTLRVRARRRLALGLGRWADV